MEVLGRSLKEIAAEKTGISRTGIPVIICTASDWIKTLAAKTLQQRKRSCLFCRRFFPSAVSRS